MEEFTPESLTIDLNTEPEFNKETTVQAVDLALKHNTFGCALFKAQKTKESLKHFHKAFQALSTNGQNFPYTNALQNLGNAYAQLKELGMALKCYQKVIEYSPFSKEEDRKENSKNENLEKTIIFNPKLNRRDALVDAYTNAAFTLLDMQKPSEAQFYCEKSLQLDPSNKDAYINFGNVLRQTGQREKAIDFAWKMIKNSYFERTNKVLEVKKINVPDLDKVGNDGMKEDEVVNVVTMKWGTKYDSEYVNKIYRGIERNTSKKFNFICFTDNSEGLDQRIEVREILEDWKRLVCKSTMFSDLHKLEGLNFFIDLDMIITGNLDEILSYKGNFALMCTDQIQNETLNKGGYNSSVVLWRGKAFDPIYSTLKECFEDLIKFVFRFDYWLEMIVVGSEFVQNVFPGQLPDFMAECQNSLPENARIVAFPRNPKPHEVADKVDWVKEHWI